MLGEYIVVRLWYCSAVAERALSSNGEKVGNAKAPEDSWLGWSDDSKGVASAKPSM